LQKSSAPAAGNDIGSSPSAQGPLPVLLCSQKR
jgi:hypothetical protein